MTDFNLSIMNRTNLFLLAIAISSTLNFSCCKVDDNPDPSYSLSMTQIITAGTWNISEIVTTGNENIPVTYNPYTFSFKADGSIIAHDATSGLTGKWNYDKSNNLFTIQLQQNSILEYLNNSWQVFPKNSLDVKLETEKNLQSLTVYLKRQ
jgi:hypothetical protein